MSTELAKAYDPALIEEKWSAFWANEAIFDVPTPGPRDAAKPFVQLLPPPNVTGRLHMGHMLNQTEMDILTRWHRMLGDTALWIPGTDHAGIATQMMVERQLAAEGKSRTDFSREAFTEKVWAWKHQYGSAITDQMRRLGASVDWSREYFTMDDVLSVAVKEAFVRLHEQDLIYRGAYIVNWDPVLQTAVSDLEVESEERVGKLYHIRYPLADGSGSIVIATTRPETMLGDTAVAVNPNDERYKHLLGQMLTLPLAGGRQIPIIADDWANPEFGTGAVKVTPAHDPNDFAIGQRHPEIGSISIFDKTARVDLPGSPFHGLDRYDAREKIVEQLRLVELLVEIKDHPMTVPVSQRTRAVIEPRLSEQWFLKIQPLADKAVAAVRDGHIKFTPEMYTKTYMEWMNNIHDWCLSRQLWWGHRIPAWHCSGCKHIMVARTAPSACENCHNNTLVQDPDVLDTWFSSGLLPFTIFGWDGNDVLTPDLSAFYPTQLLVTGFDILFFWVARMIMLGCHLMQGVPMLDAATQQLRQRTPEECVPFREVYIHALVRDADRQKMSKTKGNVIDPIGIVTKYGTDAVRFTLASQASPGTDIAFNEARTEGYRAFANKIWNAARFIQMNIDRAREAGYTVNLNTAVGADAPLETRWIVSRLSAVCSEIANSLSAYRFDEAANAVYKFFWGEFCDWYLELVKLRLDFFPDESGAFKPYSDVTAVTLNALVTVFEAALRLLSPFMPFLTEELWHALYASINQPSPAKSIALTRYPQQGDFSFDPASVAEMGVMQDLIVSVRSSRKQTGVPEKETISIELKPITEARDIVQKHEELLLRMARVVSVNYVSHFASEQSVTRTTLYDVAVLYERQIDIPAERERLTKDLAKFAKGVEAAEKQLNNEGFIARAPAAIVEGLRKQYADTVALKQKAEAALAALPKE
ncbi:MAG: valine--tRNA ligase [Acidobacteria bacterium]|nr:valine--tRNA ligase [Acidobacteriota bacterium]